MERFGSRTVQVLGVAPAAKPGPTIADGSAPGAYHEVSAFPVPCCYFGNYTLRRWAARAAERGPPSQMDEPRGKTSRRVGVLYAS
uniref:Uncharacterized protein n=1 Tax=Peronospora matthiolae TaxID=2874970 RepID=A0AAV1T6P0_9STRA